MRSRTSLFNPALFKKTVLRFWPVWFIYAFIWILAFPIGIGGEFARYSRLYTPEAGAVYALVGMPLDAVSSPYAHVLSLIASCASAAAVFSHLYSQRSASAYGSLPIRREGAFITLSLAGLLPLLAANVLVAACALAAEALCGKLVLWPVLTWLGVVSLECVAFFGISAFCAQLTGNLIVLPVLVAVLTSAAAIAQSLLTGLLRVFVFGYSDRGSSFELLSPIAGLGRYIRAVPVYEEAGDGVSYLAGYTFSGWECALIYAAAGAVLLALALLLYRRRALETAGDVVAVPWLRPVFKYLLALGCSLALGSVLFSLASGDVRYGTAPYAVELAVFMCFGAFIGYFAAEMLIKKSFSVFRGARRWAGLGAVCLCAAVFVLVCETGLFGYETRVPQRDDIVSVDVDVSGNDGRAAHLTDGEGIASVLALHESIISHKAGHEEQANEDAVVFPAIFPASTATDISLGYAGEDGEDGDDRSNPECWAIMNLKYTLADGSTVSRAYSLLGRDTWGDIRSLESLMNTPAAIESRKATDFPVTLENIMYASVYSGYYGLGGGEEYTLELSEEDAHELYYDCILPDMADGTIGLVWLVQDNGYYDSVYDCSIYIECYERLRTLDGGERYQSFHVVPNENSLRTNAWLADHGVRPLTLSEAMEASEAA